MTFIPTLKQKEVGYHPRNLATHNVPGRKLSKEKVMSPNLLAVAV